MDAVAISSVSRIIEEINSSNHQVVSSAQAGNYFWLYFNISEKICTYKCSVYFNDNKSCKVTTAEQV